MEERGWGGRDAAGPLGGCDNGQSIIRPRSNTLAGMLDVVIRSFKELKAIKLQATVNQEWAVAGRLGDRKVFDAKSLAGCANLQNEPAAFAFFSSEAIIIYEIKIPSTRLACLVIF